MITLDKKFAMDDERPSQRDNIPSPLWEDEKAAVQIADVTVEDERNE